MRLIDADTLLKKIEEKQAKAMWPPEWENAKIVVREAPTIDPVKHEWWEPCGEGLYKCSGEKCEQKADRYQRLLWKYCPACGSMMDGGKHLDAPPCTNCPAYPKGAG